MDRYSQIEVSGGYSHICTLFFAYGCFWNVSEETHLIDIWKSNLLSISFFSRKKVCRSWFDLTFLFINRWTRNIEFPRIDCIRRTRFVVNSGKWEILNESINIDTFTHLQYISIQTFDHMTRAHHMMKRGKFTKTNRLSIIFRPQLTNQKSVQCGYYSLLRSTVFTMAFSLSVFWSTWIFVIFP